MVGCPICDHAKIGAIDAALAIEIAPAVIAGKYHIAKKLIELHAAHRSPGMAVRQVLAETSADEAIEASVETWLEAIQPGLPHVRRAAQLIKHHQDYERLVAVINDALQSETMGLP